MIVSLYASFAARMCVCVHVCMCVCVYVCMYARFSADIDRGLCVRSDHRVSGQECRNEIVAVQVDGDAESGENNRVRILRCHLSISSVHF